MKKGEGERKVSNKKNKDPSVSQNAHDDEPPAHSPLTNLDSKRTLPLPRRLSHRQFTLSHPLPTDRPRITPHLTLRSHPDPIFFLNVQSIRFWRGEEESEGFVRSGGGGEELEVGWVPEEELPIRVAL